MGMPELVVHSPVHIGSGEKLTPYDFVFGEGKLTVVNVSSFLSESRERAEDFYTHASRRGFSLRDFLTDEEVSAHRRYALRCFKEPKDVSSAIKTAHGGAYIPGSSIKGALRTALACYFLSRGDDEVWEIIKNGKDNTDIRGIRRARGRRDEKMAGEVVEKALFRCGYKRKEGDRFTSYGDAKYDILKLIAVRDTPPVPPEDCLEVSMIKVYSFNGARVKAKGFETFVESIQPGSTFELEVLVDTKFIARAEEIESETRWIGLQDKLESLFGISGGEGEQVIERKVLTVIEEACRFFADKVIERELSILPEELYVHSTCGTVLTEDLKNRGKNYCSKCKEGNLNGSNVIKLGEKAKEFYESIRGKTMLRLGFSTAWYSSTVGVMLDDELLNLLRRKFGLGKRYSSIFPKTRRFAFNGEGVYPAGWVELRGVGR